MSHQTEVKTQIKDEAALEAAVQELGLALERNAMQRQYGNVHVRRDLVVKCKGPYDVGLDRQEDGTYKLATDWWGGHVEQEVGRAYSRLLPLYGVHKASIEARRRGYTVQRSLNAQGEQRLTITGRLT